MNNDGRKDITWDGFKRIVLERTQRSKASFDTAIQKNERDMEFVKLGLSDETVGVISSSARKLREAVQICYNCSAYQLLNFEIYKVTDTPKPKPFRNVFATVGVLVVCCFLSVAVTGWAMLDQKGWTYQQVSATFAQTEQKRYIDIGVTGTTRDMR